MKNNRVLIVEDEINLGKTLSEYLNDKGFECYHAVNCEQARFHFSNRDSSPNIVLMDVQLPDGDGIELAKQLREKRINIVKIKPTRRKMGCCSLPMNGFIPRLKMK